MGKPKSQKTGIMWAKWAKSGQKYYKHQNFTRKPSVTNVFHLQCLPRGPLYRFQPIINVLTYDLGLIRLHVRLDKSGQKNLAKLGKGQWFFVILGLFRELIHNKGFPLALYSNGVPGKPEKFSTPTMWETCLKWPIFLTFAHFSQLDMEPYQPWANKLSVGIDRGDL